MLKLLPIIRSFSRLSVTLYDISPWVILWDSAPWTAPALCIVRSQLPSSSPAQHKLVSSPSARGLGLIEKTCVSVDGRYLQEMKALASRSGRGDGALPHFSEWNYSMDVPSHFSPHPWRRPLIGRGSQSLTSDRLLWMSPRARTFILPPVSDSGSLKKERCKRRQVRVSRNFGEDGNAELRLHGNRRYLNLLSSLTANSLTSAPSPVLDLTGEREKKISVTPSEDWLV